MKRATKPLLVGEAPSVLGGSPLLGPCGRRLAGLAGLSYAEYFEAFDRENLVPYVVGDDWPTAQATRLGGELMARVRWRRGRVVLFGRRVAAACGLDVEFFAEIQHGRAVVVVAPHPSGLNRWYNEPENIAAMSAFLRRIVGG